MGKEYEEIKAEISVRISTEDIDDLEDLEEAIRNAGLEVTQERVDKLLEECRRIFDDKSGRNEMLAQKASELFEEE